MIPGSNLLAAAMTLISPQAAYLYRYAGRVRTLAGDFVTAFEAPVLVPNASVQAVEASRYEELGLDRKKAHTSLFGSALIIGVRRDGAPDEYTFAGRRYQVVTEAPWFVQDGWTSVIGVDIGEDAASA